MFQNHPKPPDHRAPEPIEIDPVLPEDPAGVVEVEAPADLVVTAACDLCGASGTHDVKEADDVHWLCDACDPAAPAKVEGDQDVAEQP